MKKLTGILLATSLAAGLLAQFECFITPGYLNAIFLSHRNGFVEILCRKFIPIENSPNTVIVIIISTTVP